MSIFSVFSRGNRRRHRARPNRRRRYFASAAGRNVGIVLLSCVFALAGVGAPALAAGSNPAASGPYPVCSSGYVYSVYSGGAVKQINNNTSPPSVTNFGSWAGQSDVNGLGISANGSAIYAYNRIPDNSGNPSIAQALRYTPSTNTWQTVANPYSTGLSGALVAGGVDLKTGNFLFGGFDENTGDFYLYQFNPVTQAFLNLGYFATGLGYGGNGDLALDAAGNLFVVDSSSGSLAIFTVTAANLAQAVASPGNSIPATNTKSIANLPAVNGIAFDADGTVYLGTSSSVYHYDPTNWNLLSVVTSSLSGSTDLASCNSPGTITVQKNVVARASASDQFTMSLANTTSTPAATVGTATTTGGATGLQQNQIGPVPAVTNSSYTITEAMAPGSASSMSAYSATWACTDASGTVASGNGYSGSFVMPGAAPGGAGSAVVCTFTNSPISNLVTLTKRWVSAPNGSTAALSITGPGVTNAVGATSVSGEGPNPDTTNQATASAYLGSTVSLVETLGGTAAAYAPSYSCTQSGTSWSATSNTFTMPSGGSVNCIVTNTASSVNVQVNKTWTIKDPTGHTIGTYNIPSQPGDSGAALPAGFAATLQLTGQQNPQFGTSYAGYVVGQNNVTIGETGVVVPSGCTLTSSTLTSINGTALGTARTLPYTNTNSALTASPNPNVFGITNTVTCTQSLTLVAHVGFGNASPTSWLLTGTGPSGSASGPNGVTGSAGASAAVTPNVPYSLAQAYIPSGVNNYVPDGDWVCVDAGGNSVPFVHSAVSVGYGQSVTCVITNWTAIVSVLKTIQGSGLTPTQFALTLTPPTGLGSAVTFPGNGQSTSSNTFEVKPGASYGLSEASQAGGLPFLALGLQVSTNGGADWVGVDQSNFTPTAGTQVLYRFVNQAVTPVVLPLTGGLGTDVVWLTGGAVLASAAALAMWQLIRRRASRRS